MPTGPSDKTQDFSAPMLEEGQGRYSVQVAFPRFGVWDGLIAVRQGEDEFTTGQTHQRRPPLSGPGPA